jgi:3-oxoacyl-[acyl-carrier protein] reductase
MAAEGARVVTNSRRPGSTGPALLSARNLEALAPEDRDKVDGQLAALSGDAESTAAAIRAAGGEAVAFFGDISDFGAAAELMRTAADTFGAVDVLVNVAGAFGFSAIWDLSEETWDRVTATKPKGHFNTIRHAAPHMMARGWGRIINCTSRSFFGDPLRHAGYCAANAGVVGLTRAAAIELAPFGITCNAFSPWAFTRASVELEAYEMAAAPGKGAWVSEEHAVTAASTPAPERVVPFLVYLAGEAAGHVSGSVFTLGGNRIGLYSEPVVAHSLTKSGPDPWSVDEIVEQAPAGLLLGYRNTVGLVEPPDAGQRRRV